MKKTITKKTKLRLFDFKVTLNGPVSKVVFMVYGKKSAEAVRRFIRKDENRLSVLRKERIYVPDLKNMKIERV